jgi:hypothetical protein
MKTILLLLLLALVDDTAVLAASNTRSVRACGSALQCEPWVKTVLNGIISSSSSSCNGVCNGSSSSSSNSSSLKRPHSAATAAADVTEEQKPPADPALYKALLQLSLTARGGNHGVLSPDRLKAAMDAHSDRYSSYTNSGISLTSYSKTSQTLLAVCART